MGADADLRLREAAATGDLNAVRAALADGAGVNGRGEFGDSALNAAAERGHAETVDALLVAGADIENAGGADKTPLMNAAFAGHAGVVRKLIEKGARVSDSLLRTMATKVSILEENAENGMVRREAAEAWRGFLDELIAERRKQDAAAHAGEDAGGPY